MSELPYEIWAYIASLLPPDVLSSVQFSLNRPFLECGLREKYRVVHFGEFANRQALYAFYRLRDPTLAARVQHLTFRNEPFPVCVKSSVPGPRPVVKKTRWKGIVVSLKGGGDSPHRPNPMPGPISVPDFLDIISNMTNLTSFTLHSARHPSVGPRHHCSQILDSALHSFHATLNTLRITIAVDITSWTLPATTTTLLPNLQHFEVNLDRCSLYPGDGLFDNTLAPFLNAHRTTIESLSVGLYRCTLIHLSTILDPLDLFPHLTALSLTQNLPSEFPKVENEAQIVASAIHRFALHSAPRLVQLEVDLWPCALAAFASHPFNDGSSQVHPRIQILKIHSQRGMVAVRDALSPSLFVDLLRPIIPTLVDLELTPMVLGRLEFKSLLGAFPRRSPNPPLRRLAIEVVSLALEVFSYASMMLPELKALELGYCYFDSPTTGGPLPIGPGFGSLMVSALRVPTIEFCRHLQDSPRFDDWGLERLHLKPLITQPWGSCKMAIAEAFPRVRTFNGASREEYLASSNMSPI